LSRINQLIGSKCVTTGNKKTGQILGMLFGHNEFEEDIFSDEEGKATATRITFKSLGNE
jgi:hypothetical protein